MVALAPKKAGLNCGYSLAFYDLVWIYCKKPVFWSQNNKWRSKL